MLALRFKSRRRRLDSRFRCYVVEPQRSRRRCRRRFLQRPHRHDRYRLQRRRRLRSLCAHRWRAIMGEHIPGNPTVVPQNMPGAGSLKVANYLYNVAPKDGTVDRAPSRAAWRSSRCSTSSGIAFDAQKFNWIGSITNEVSVCAFRSDRRHQDLAGHADEALHGRRHRLGRRHRRLPARAAQHVRHEDEARRPAIPAAATSSWRWSAARSTAAAAGRGRACQAQQVDWLDEKKIDVPVQLALEKHADLPDVPLIMDLTQDPNEQRRAEADLRRARAMARPYAAPPGVPADRVAALRKAFDDDDEGSGFPRRGAEDRSRSAAGLRRGGASARRRIYASSPEVVKIAADATKSAARAVTASRRKRWRGKSGIYRAPANASSSWHAIT